MAVKTEKRRLTMEEFCRVWEAARTVKEVSEKTGLPPASAMSRAATYRAAPYNVPLKKFKKGRPPSAQMGAEAARLAISLGVPPARPLSRDEANRLADYVIALLSREGGAIGS